MQVGAVKEQVGAVKERIAIWQVTLRGSESMCVDAGGSGEGEDRHMAGDAPWL